MKRKHLVKALGIAVCLIGAFLMAWGDPVLGENHSGIATVIGIIGIGIISTSNNIQRSWEAS